MPKLSQKATRMPSSPIRKLVPSADIAIAKGIEVFFLNIGQPDIHSPKESIEVLNNWNKNTIAYTRSEGTVEYREQLVKYFGSKGINDLDINNFIITQGGSEALIFALSIIGDEGDEIIIPEPFYANYNGFSIQSNMNVIPVTSNIEDGFALPPISDFEAKITIKTRGIIICHPGNPTGYMYSRKELEQLKDLVLKHDLFLISDEVYREYTYDKDYISVLEFEELKNNVIIIDSESKRFSMCGLRLGSLISRNEDFIKAAIKFAQARLSPSEIAQKMAAAAFEHSSTYIDNARAKYKERRDYLIKALNEIDGVYAPMPQGAFYCVAKLPVDDSELFAKWMLEEFEYKGKTIMVAPAAGFYSSPEKGKNEVRIAYVLDISSLQESVKILERGLIAYNRK